MGRERASQALSDHASDAMTIYAQLTSSVLRGVLNQAIAEAKKRGHWPGEPWAKPSRR